MTTPDYGTLDIRARMYDTANINILWIAQKESDFLIIDQFGRK